VVRNANEIMGIEAMLGRIHSWRKSVFAALAALTLLGFLAVAPMTLGASLHVWLFWGSEQLISILLPD